VSELSGLDTSELLSRLRDIHPLFELASLLRQLMRHRQGEAINTLDGSRWLSALDHEFDTQWFSQGRGQVFGNSLYQSSSISQSDLKQLCKELKDEIKRLKSPMSIKQSFA